MSGMKGELKKEGQREYHLCIGWDVYLLNDLLHKFVAGLKGID
jgi:hypothetical protein